MEVNVAYIHPLCFPSAQKRIQNVASWLRCIISPSFLNIKEIMIDDSILQLFLQLGNAIFTSKFALDAKEYFIYLYLWYAPRFGMIMWNLATYHNDWCSKTFLTHYHFPLKVCYLWFFHVDALIIFFFGGLLVWSNTVFAVNAFTLRVLSDIYYLWCCR